MTKPIVPPSSEIIAPAIAALTGQRPRSFQAVNYGQGNYSVIFKGLEAQVNLALNELLGRVIARNPYLASDADRTEYIDSEYELPPTDPTKAVGSLTLDRTTSTSPKIEGVVRKGSRIRRSPAPNITIPLVAADYVVSRDTYVALNQNTVTVPIEAVQTGEAPNVPYAPSVVYPMPSFSDTLFDTNFSITAFDAAGGSSGRSKLDELRYMTSYALSQYGPVDDALVAAAMRAGAASHVLVDGADVWVADPVWGGSSRWAGLLAQAMNEDEILGYSTRFNVRLIPSIPVGAQLTVMMRDSRYLADTSAIDTEIRDAIRSYFDDRVNFNIVTNAALQGVVSRVDPIRVLRCTSAALVNLDGSPFTMPTSVSHAYLANVTVSYIPPV